MTRRLTVAFIAVVLATLLIAGAGTLGMGAGGTGACSSSRARR